jgi:hypothetical protein
VLAGREHHLADRNHALLADCFSDNSERLLTDFTIRHDVVGVVEVQLVDLFLRDKLVDVDRPLALDGDRFQLFRVKFEVLALAACAMRESALGTNAKSCNVHFVAPLLRA